MTREIERFGGAPEDGLSRREVLQRAAALGLAVPTVGSVLAACGGSDDTGAGGEPRRGGQLLVGISAGGGGAVTLNPLQGIDIFEQFSHSAIYDPLVRFDYDSFDWVPQPRLATKWESNEDATQWTISLREAEWHDGKPFTAKDVAWTLKEFLRQKASYQYNLIGGKLRPEGIEVADDRTLVLRLEQGEAFLMNAMGNLGFAIIQDGTTEKDFEDGKAIGTGPFVLKSWNPGRSFEVVRNDAYWEEGRPFADSIRVTVFPEETTAVQAVGAGEIQYYGEVSPPVIRAVEGTSGVRVAEGPSGLLDPIILNESVPPFDDPLVRRAFKLAVDRQQVLDVAYNGRGAVTADVPLPPNDRFFPSDLEIPVRDTEGSRALLAEAGFPNGLDIEIITTNAYGGMVDTAVVVAETLAEGGFRASVDRRSPDVYYTDYPAFPVFVTNWLRQQAYLALKFWFQSQSAVNESRFNSPKVDKLLQRAGTTVDENAQATAIGEALKLVAENSGWVQPATLNQLYVVRDELKGVRGANYYMDEWGLG